MADISVIKLPSGSEYNIKDAWARQAIEGLGNPTVFLLTTFLYFKGIYLALL